MGIWDSITGVVGDTIGQWVTGKNQKKAASKAWDREQAASAKSFERSYDAYKSRYQDTMGDMKAAGLNPIMAASGGFNVGNSVTYPKANAPMAQTPNYEFTASAKRWSEANKAQEETKKVTEEIKEVRAKTQKALADTYLSRAKKGLVKQQERETVKKILVLEKEVWLKIAQFEKTMKESYKAVAERKLIRKKTMAIQYELEKLKDISSVYKNVAGQWLAYLREVMSSFGSLLGGGAAAKIIK